MTKHELRSELEQLMAEATVPIKKCAYVKNSIFDAVPDHLWRGTERGYRWTPVGYRPLPKIETAA